MLSCSAQAPFVPPAPTATTPLPLQRGKGGGGGAQAGLALALRDPEKGGLHGRRRRREQGGDPPPQPLTSADPAAAAMDLARLDARGARLYSFLRCPPRGRPPLLLPLMAAARSSASAPPFSRGRCEEAHRPARILLRSHGSAPRLAGRRYFHARPLPGGGRRPLAAPAARRIWCLPASRTHVACAHPGRERGRGERERGREGGERIRFFRKEGIRYRRWRVDPTNL